MEWHPIACIFPMLSDEKLRELSDDIEQHGQREDIVLLGGKVLDGRNRWLACKMAGIEPRTRNFKGTPSQAIEFVWSTNVHRRHMNSGQVAMALAKREQVDKEFAAVVEQIKKEQPKGGRPAKEKPVQTIEPVSRKDNSRLTDHKLAESYGTNRTYVAKSRKVLEQAPDLADKVERSELTLAQASTELRRRQRRQELEEKAEAAKAESYADGQPPWILIHDDILSGLQSVLDNHTPPRLIFTDPPYNIGIQYGDHHDDSMPDADFIGWCNEWLRACRDCLADDGSLWVMINDEYAADIKKSLDGHGLHMRAWIKWYETFGVNCSNNFNRTSRHIFYFVRDPKRFVFNETAALRPSDRQAKYNDKRAQSSGKILDDVWQIPRLSGTAKERIPDVPTQLPIELVQRIVEIASEPGDTVLDPFNGSGTTGVASVRSGRKYIGLDASEKFIDIADKRLRGET